MKVIIAGSRNFNDWKILKAECDDFLQSESDIEIVSGNARGADKLGERYAATKGYSVKIFHADWNKLGKSAGHFRNVSMANYADALIAFWDGESRGTKDMIEIAENEGLKVKIVNYSKNSMSSN